MYRYRESTSGSTDRSLKAMKHISKIGDLLLIKGYCYNSKDNIKQCAVLVKGTNGSCRFSGFSWGYNGSGPSGLQKLLVKLNVDKSEIDRVLLCNWNGWANIGTFWVIKNFNH